MVLEDRGYHVVTLKGGEIEVKLRLGNNSWLIWEMMMAGLCQAGSGYPTLTN